MISSQRKIYLIVLAFAAFCVLVIGFGVSPAISSIKRSAQDLALKKATLELLQSQLTSSRQFQENYPLLKQDLESVKDSFIDSDAPIDFMEFLELEAAKANLEMVVFPISAPLTTGGLWPNTSLRLSLGGDFADCLRFLEKLEQSPLLLEVYRLDVERVSGAARAPREFANLRVGDVSFVLYLTAFSNGLPSEEEK